MVQRVSTFGNFGALEEEGASNVLNLIFLGFELRTGGAEWLARAEANGQRGLSRRRTTHPVQRHALDLCARANLQTRDWAMGTARGGIPRRTALCAVRCYLDQ